MTTTATTLPTLSQGDAGNDVMWAQYLLVRRTMIYEQVDGVFGSYTAKGVRQFQDLKGLETDGIIGALTWAALGGTRLRPPNLKVGSQSAVVSSLQTALNLGRGDFSQTVDPPLAVDGDFGPLTARAVRGTQTLAGIPVDGMVGLQTWALSVHAAGGTLASLTGVTAPAP